MQLLPVLRVYSFADVCLVEHQSIPDFNVMRILGSKNFKDTKV